MGNVRKHNRVCFLAACRLTPLPPANSHGGQEAHLVASQLADAGIDVILTSPRSFPTTWDSRRALPGPPLTADTAVTILHQAGVRVALGVSLARLEVFDLSGDSTPRA